MSRTTKRTAIALVYLDASLVELDQLFADAISELESKPDLDRETFLDGLAD